MSQAEEAPFVLDQEANPHPRLLELALDARRRAGRSDTNMAAKAYYLGVMHSMVAATGCDLDELVGWLDRHDPGEPQPPEGGFS